MINPPTENHFINIHAHRKPRYPEEWSLRNAFSGVSPLSLGKIPYPVSVGLHPWFVNEDYEKEVVSLESLLKLKNVWAVGEIGLDKVTNVALDLQRKAFEAQLKLAEHYHKPTIIHAVKAYSDLFPYLQKRHLKFILHQYRGNEIQTSQLLQLDHVFFSFGKDLLNNKKVIEIFKAIPLNRIFFETDMSPVPVSHIYQTASLIKDIRVSEIQREVYRTFSKVF